MASSCVFLTRTPNDNHSWKDITSFLDEVSQELVVGQIVKADPFTMFEAMSAVELLDPKMDPSFGAEKVISFEEARSDGRLKPSSALSVANIVGLCDHLLMSEMMWLDGFPMSQSLLTCLYFHHSTALLDDKVFAPFIKSIRLSCAYINETIREADIHEEEDYVSSLCGVYLPQPVKAEVAKALADLGAGSEAIASLEASPELKKALTCRLEFAKGQLEFLSGIFSDRVKNLPKAVAVTAKIQRVVAEIAIDKEFRDPGDVVIQQDIGKRLYFSVHPRKVPPPNFADTMTKFDALFKQLRTLCSQLQTTTALDKLEQIILDLVHLKANILTRSLWTVLVLQVPEMKVLGTRSLSDCLVQMTKDLYDVPDLVYQQAPLKDFLAEAVRSYAIYIKVVAANKARRLQRLAQMMGEWETLVNIGGHCDQTIREDEAFSSVHYGYCLAFEWQLRGMIMFLQLGFDLGLYSPHEVISVHWYLENLFFMRARNMTMLLTFNLDLKNLVRAAERGGGKTKKSGKKGGKLGAAPTKKSQEPKPTAHSTEVSALFTLQRGLLRLLVALYLEKKLEIDVAFDLGSPTKRYLTRFRPFYRVIHPQPITYETWLEHKAQFSAAKFTEATSMATNLFGEARKELDKLLATDGKPSAFPSLTEAKRVELQGIYKAAVANAVQLAMMLKLNLHKDATKKVVIAYDASKDFPVVSLK